MRERQPTDEEARFWDRLSLEVPGLLDWYHQDPDGSPWMYASLDVTASGARSITRTWRLDFDGDEIAAGESPATLNWDDGVRAASAGMDFEPPDGLKSSVSGPEQAADLAAAWFRDRMQAEER